MAGVDNLINIATSDRPFDRLRADIKDGNSYASAQKKLEFNKQKHELDKQKFKELQNDNAITRAGKLVATLKQAQSLPPVTGKAFLKSSLEQFKRFGITVAPEAQAALFDPEMAATYSKALDTMDLSMRIGDTEGQADAARTITESIGLDGAIKGIQNSAKANEALQKMQDEQMFRSDEAATERDFKASESALNRGATAKAADVKAKTEAVKVKREQFKNLRKDAEAITKELSPRKQAFINIRNIVKKDPNFSNPQTGIAVVRISQAMTEAQKSVVRESEFALSATNAAWLEKVWDFNERQFKNKKVPHNVIQDIVKLSTVMSAAFKEVEKQRYAPIVNEMEASGIKGNEALRILGRSEAKQFAKQLGIESTPTEKMNKAELNAAKGFQAKFKRAPTEKEAVRLKEMVRRKLVKDRKK